MMQSVDPVNTFGVGRLGENIVIEWPVPKELTKGEALNLAAWLAALADLEDVVFDALLRAVRAT